MLGIRIFLHSIKLILRNWRFAVQISLPALIPWIAGLVFFAVIGPIHDTFWAVLLGSTFVFLVGIGLIWTAVAWHRFVLLCEMPEGVVPEFQLTFWAYVWRALVINIILIPIMMFFGFLIGFTGSMAELVFGLDWFDIVENIGIFVLSLYFFYRLSPLLPAAALGEKMKISEAWNFTSGFFASVLLISILHLILWIGFYVTISVITFDSVYLSQLIVTVVGWFYLMTGISVLTTIYGVAVENREL